MRNYAKQVMRPGPKGPERVKDGPIVFFNSEDGPPPEANGSPSLRGPLATVPRRPAIPSSG